MTFTITPYVANAALTTKIARHDHVVKQALLTTASTVRILREIMEVFTPAAPNHAQLNTLVCGITFLNATNEKIEECECYLLDETIDLWQDMQVQWVRILQDLNALVRLPAP